MMGLFLLPLVKFAKTHMELTKIDMASALNVTMKMDF